MTATYTSMDLRGVISPRTDGSFAKLKAFLAGHRGRAVLAADDGTSTEVPDEVYEVIAQAVDALAEGSAVRVAAISTRLTTTQAAELLGVSRPTLVKMLDDGKVPFEQLNVHRTVRLADVVAYRDRRRTERGAVLDELTREGVDDGLYDDSYADYAQALDDARHHRS